MKETDSLVEKGGDGYKRKNPKKKREYETREARERLLQDVDKSEQKMIHALGKRLLSHEELKEMHFVDMPTVPSPSARK